MMQSSESQSLLSDTGTASGVLIGTQPHFGSYRGFAMPHPTNTTVCDTIIPTTLPLVLESHHDSC